MYFVQAKSVQETETLKLVVRERVNVELAPYEPGDESVEDEVLPFVIETEELLTIQSMGSVMPVLLYLVTLDTGHLYFLCLNDYIEKILHPQNENWATQATNTIYVPTRNRISMEEWH